MNDFGGIGITIEPARTPQFIVLYGKPGTHKTTAACHSENPVIIAVGNETGHEKMHVPKYENKSKMEPLKFVELCIKHLLETDHSRKTVIIDNLGEYHDCVVQDIFLRKPTFSENNVEKPVESLSDYGFGKGNSYVYPYFTRLFAGLKALQTKKNMDVIVIAHECHYNINLPDGNYFQKIGMNVQGGEKTSVRDLLERKADSILYMQRIDKTVVSSEKKFGKPVRRATGGDGEVTVSTRETGLYFAKRRVLMDDVYNIPYSDETTINRRFDNSVYKEIFNLLTQP